MPFNLFPPDEFSSWWPYALASLVIVIILILATHGKDEEKESTLSK